MANLPISGLTSLAEAPAEDDEIELLDKSDTTYHSNGTNKRNSLANFRKGVHRVVSESSDFTIDPAVHTDGCIVLLDPNSGSSYRLISCPVLASQPSAGYSITILMTGFGSVRFNSNDGINEVADGGTNTVRVFISYIGSDVWSGTILTAGGVTSGFFTNADA